MGSPAEPKDTAKTGEIQRGTSSSRGLLNFKLKVVKMPKDGRKRKRRNRRKTKPAEPPKLTAIEEYIQSLEGYEQGIPTPIILKYFFTKALQEIIERDKGESSDSESQKEELETQTETSNRIAKNA